PRKPHQYLVFNGSLCSGVRGDHDSIVRSTAKSIAVANQGLKEMFPRQAQDRSPSSALVSATAKNAVKVAIAIRLHILSRSWRTRAAPNAISKWINTI